MASLQVPPFSLFAFSRARHGVTTRSSVCSHSVETFIKLGLLLVLSLSGLDLPPLTLEAAAHSSPPSKEKLSDQDWPVFLARVRSNALNHSNQLPDFICNQTTQIFVRSYSPTLAWRKTGSFVALLSFYDKKEHYEILSVNEKPAPGTTIDNLTRVLSIGEFGSALRGLFEHKTQAEFQPVGHKKINNIKTVCIAFKVSQERSSRFIAYNDQTIMTAYRGRYWVNPANHRIIRLEKKLVGIPRDFPVTRFDMSVDYSPVTISEVSHWLPKKAEIWINRRLPGSYSNPKKALMQTRSKIRFDGYRRFRTGVKLVTD